MSGLTISRKEGEAIIIGNEIRVVVKSIGTERVKINIVAPKRIEVHREELNDRLREFRAQKLEADLS